jgi:biopolymer transport protein ExbB/TolQ
MAVALITTLAGLIVAIPSYIAYHYLASKVRIFEKQLNEIAERFLISAKQTFVK